MILLKRDLLSETLFPGNHDQAARENPERETGRKEETYHEREDPRTSKLFIVFCYLYLPGKKETSETGDQP